MRKPMLPLDEKDIVARIIEKIKNGKLRVYSIKYVNRWFDLREKRWFKEHLKFRISENTIWYYIDKESKKLDLGRNSVAQIRQACMDKHPLFQDLKERLS